MTVFLYVILIGLQLEAISTAATEGASWTALSDYDDRLPDTQVISTSPTIVHNKGECSLKCQRLSGCNGFFFNDVSKTCLPTAVTMSYRRDVIVNGVISNGYRYYLNGATCPVPTFDSLVHAQSSICFQVIADVALHKNWTDARDACDSDGGRLAVLDTKDKMDTVMNVMRDNTDFPELQYYLGAHRPIHMWNTSWPNDEQDYIWLNGQPLDLTAPYWLYGEPNNLYTMQNVIGLHQNLDRPWEDLTEFKTRGYICEFSLI